MNATQLSMDEALAARDAALERVEAAADADWKFRANAAVLYVCMYFPEFTSEDVWSVLDKPREPRALGPILKWFAREHYCEPIGWVECGMVSRHGTAVRKYRSLIYEAA